MTLEQIDSISVWALGIGFLYAMLVGAFLIPMVTDRMYDLVDPQFKGKFKHKWQPPIIGLTERSLYILSLLGGHAGFIGLWVGLKVGIPYIRWADDYTDKKDPAKGRSLFMNSLYGNALSILYSVVGYFIILWWDKGAYDPAIYIGFILIAFNLILWIGLIVYPYCRDYRIRRWRQKAREHGMKLKP